MLLELENLGTFDVICINLKVMLLLNGDELALTKLIEVRFVNMFDWHIGPPDFIPVPNKWNMAISFFLFCLSLSLSISIGLFLFYTIGTKVLPSWTPPSNPFSHLYLLQTGPTLFNHSFSLFFYFLEKKTLHLLLCTPCRFTFISPCLTSATLSNSIPCAYRPTPWLALNRSLMLPIFSHSPFSLKILHGLISSLYPHYDIQRKVTCSSLIAALRSLHPHSARNIRSSKDEEIDLWCPCQPLRAGELLSYHWLEHFW